MKNLNLSKDVADFIATLDREKAKQIWTLIDQLLRQPGQSEYIEFGEGKCFATVNEFIIIFRADGETIDIDALGRRYEAFEINASGASGRVLGLDAAAQASSSENISFELFTLSFALVACALAIFRWFSADLNIFAPITVLPLVACLAGAALGVWNKQTGLFRFAPACLLLSIVVPLSLNYAGLGASGPVPSSILQYQGNSPGLAVGLLLALISLLLAGPFCFSICMGIRIGDLFAKENPLVAFSTVLSALLVGYLAVALTTAASLPPPYQIAIAPLVLLLFPSPELKPRLPLYACLVVATVAAFIALPRVIPGYLDTSFSPYHKVTVHEDPLSAGSAINSVLDDTLQQALIPQSVEANSGIKNGDLADFYRLPFVVKQPSTLLVINSGLGAEIQESLKEKVESVDAVELDSVLSKLGKKYNSAYKASVVHLRSEDPRCYLQNCKQKYDMIIIACQNFVTPIGITSKVEYPSQFTRQFYRKCLSLLNPNGILLFSLATPSYTDSHWLRDRFYVTAKEACGYAPIVLQKTDAQAGFSPYIFILSKDANLKDILQRLPSKALGYAVVQMPESIEAKVTTDDFPYVYFRAGVNEALYILCSLVLIALVGCFGQSHIFSKSADALLNWQLFFLNSALVTMILGCIPRLLAMVGNSWLSTTTIFGGILAIAWFANNSIRKSGAAQYEFVLYVGLFVWFIINLFLPVPWLSSLGLAGNITIAVVTIVLLFRVLLILRVIYSEATEAVPLLAFTLLGLGAGLLLSHISLYFGQNSQLLISLALFGCSLMFFIGRQKSLIPAVANIATKRIT